MGHTGLTHGFFTRDSIYAIARICHGNSVCLSVASRLAESEPYCCSGCLYVCLSVCHSATYSLPRLTDHNQIWYPATIATADGMIVRQQNQPMCQCFYVAKPTVCPWTRVSLYGSPVSHTLASRWKNMENFAYFQL